MIYVGNAFSLSMVSVGSDATDLKVGRLTTEDVKAYTSGGFGEWESVVGHESTAALFSGILNRDIVVNRKSVSLTADILLIVGQYAGPRLPEGVTVLPEGASIVWYCVSIDS